MLSLRPKPPLPTVRLGPSATRAHSRSRSATVVSKYYPTQLGTITSSDNASVAYIDLWGIALEANCLPR